MASSLVAHDAVGLRILGHRLVHLGNDRLCGVCHLLEIVAALAGHEAGFLHPVEVLLGEFRLHGLLLLGRAHRAADFTPEAGQTALGLVEEQANNLRLADRVLGLILEMAVNAGSGGATLGLGVLTLLVGGIDIIHRVAERAAELGGTGPVHNCGAGRNDVKNSLVDYILEKELSGGGWALSGTNADPDVTAMALQALCSHRYRSDVESAGRRAISKLSYLQLENGGYRSWGRENSESISQVVIALCAWGVDAAKDRRFIKNGVSALDALVGYANTDGGFADTMNTPLKSNRMATEQAAIALAAYDRYLSGGTLVYYFN